MKILKIIILLFILNFYFVYTKDIDSNNNIININNNNNDELLTIQSDNINQDENIIAEIVFNDIDQVKLEKQLKIIFPNITNQDLNLIKQVRQLNFTKVIKALTKNDYYDILMGIVAGVEKSINPKPSDCVNGIRQQIKSTNQVIYDILNLYGITIREFFDFLKILPNVVEQDIALYNTCGIDKIVKKLTSCLNVIFRQGFTVFLENEKNVLLENSLNIIPITRGIATSLLLQNYQLLGVHLGEYLGILINAPTPSTTPAISPSPTPTPTPKQSTTPSPTPKQSTTPSPTPSSTTTSSTLFSFFRH